MRQDFGQCLDARSAEREQFVGRSRLLRHIARAELADLLQHIRWGVGVDAPIELGQYLAGALDDFEIVALRGLFERRTRGFAELPEFLRGRIANGEDRATQVLRILFGRTRHFGEREIRAERNDDNDRKGNSLHSRLRERCAGWIDVS